MSKLEEPRSDFWFGFGGLIVFVVGVVLLWIAYFFLPPIVFPVLDEDGNIVSSGPGAGGDMFGSLTALFSGLAFAGLISTLLMQRRELELQRKELGLTRDEFKLQRFESTFFGLLKLFNDHVCSLKVEKSVFGIDPKTKVYVGREVLEHYAERIPPQKGERRVKNSHGKLETKAFEQDLELQVNVYEAKYHSHFESDLGPYFRLLYNTIRHIEKSDLPDDEKQRYSKIARAYLSSSEVKLLMFNCLSELGVEFRDWVVKYQLLKHISNETREENANAVAAYPPIAFAIE